MLLIVVAEALALGVVAAADLADLPADRVGSAIGVALILVLIAATLVGAAIQVVRGRSWARGPLVVAQSIQVLVAFNTQGSVAWLPWVLGGSAVIALACLLAPPVTAYVVQQHNAELGENP